jgi:hypothetical protein
MCFGSICERYQELGSLKRLSNETKVASKHIHGLGNDVKGSGQQWKE